MTSSDELNIARKKLEASLGENTKQYFQLMKKWFQLKSSKEEFDTESRKLMSADQIHLHNEFLLQLFNRCQSLTSSSTPRPMGKMTSASPAKDKTSRRAKLKRRNRSDKGSFEPADFVDYIAAPMALPPHAHDEPLRYSAQELFLPDISLILGRMLLSAWELGLDGAEESAAELLVIAVQQFLKTVLTTILCQRKGYKVRDNRFIYAMGSVVPNPWLRNTANVSYLTNSLSNEDTEVEEKDELPVQNLTRDEIEQEAAYEVACGDGGSTVQYPVTAYHVLEALQAHRNVIPSHAVYSVNIERVIAMLNHPTCEEMT